MNRGFLASLLLVGTLCAGMVGVARPLSSPSAALAATASVAGATTSWRLSEVAIHEMARIPHTTWSGYASNIHFFVISLRFTNAGKRSADPYDDLDLVMRMDMTPGWRPLDRHLAPFPPMIKAAAQQFGGVLPWNATPPGRTTTYCYVFGVRRGESHYGLFTFDPVKGYKFLFWMGV